MSMLQILLLAVLQGIAEFLPISSKGHLIIVEAVLAKLNGIALPDPLELNIVLHAGTLASILVYCRREVWRLLSTWSTTISARKATTVVHLDFILPIAIAHRGERRSTTMAPEAKKFEVFSSRMRCIGSMNITLMRYGWTQFTGFSISGRSTFWPN